MNRQYLVCAILAALSLAVIGDQNCTSNCKGYQICSSLQNQTDLTGFMNNSLSCDADKEAKLGVLFKQMDACKLKEAAIEISDLMDIAWDGVSAIEALIEDEDFWLDTCEWKHMASAACVYFSLPEAGTCTNEPNVEKTGMFCMGECMKVANSCLNLGKYKQLSASVTAFCEGLSAPNGTENCYNAQISQAGLTKPACSADTIKSVSLLGPYIVGAVGLALAVVALIGLALITCRRGDGGVPNSF